MPKDPIKVFISYSHDSEEHSDRVLTLADQLRDDGVDCWIDQYEGGTIPGGWPLETENKIEEAHFVLVVCTKEYLDRTKPQKEKTRGYGVAWEASIIRSILAKDLSKKGSFIPILFSEDNFDHIPNFLDPLSKFSIQSNDDIKKLAGQLKKLPKKIGIKPVTSSIPFNVPIHQNRFFTGREDILKQLRENLEAGKQTALTQALSGLGGVGKTQIAAEYAHRYKDSYQAVLWVDAESDASLDNSVVDIARILDLPQKDEPDRKIVQLAVQNWLASQTNWLLVLDNIEDINLYKNFVPTSVQGHVLLTTRSPTTGNIGKLEINEMKEDGVLFLLRRSGTIKEEQESEKAKPKDLETAKEINKIFGGLALALEQTGAYVEENGISLAEYLELYESSGSKLLAEKAEAGDYPEPVARAFDLSLRKTKENNTASYELIQLCAFFDPDSIPELIFKDGKEHLGDELKEAVEDSIQWKKILREAYRFSLFQRNAGDESFRMHRLVQQSIRDNQANSKEIALKAFKALSVPFPHPNNSNFETWELCRNLLPCFLAIQEWTKHWNLESVEIAKLYDSAGTFFQYVQGEYEKAEPLYNESLKIRKKVHENEHPDVASSLNNLALLYENQGRYEEAEPLYKESLKMRKKFLGDKHPDVAGSLNNLAELYRNQGRYEEAEPLYKDAHEMWQKLLGEEHPHVATSLNNLAILYTNQRRYEKAEPLYKESLKMRKKLLGDEHPDVAGSLNNLAELYRNQGRYEEAEPLFKDALMMRKKLLGEEHPTIAIALNNLAELYGSQGRYEEAEPLFKESLKMKKYLLGEEHPDVATSLNNLGTLYANKGDYQKSEVYLNQALDLIVRLLGPSHPNSITMKKNLEGVRRRMKEGK
jgi:tetratricopeptide (TPR) repeat protein